MYVPPDPNTKGVRVMSRLRKCGFQARVSRAPHPCPVKFRLVAPGLSRHNGRLISNKSATFVCCSFWLEIPRFSPCSVHCVVYHA